MADTTTSSMRGSMNEHGEDIDGGEIGAVIGKMTEVISEGLGLGSDDPVPDTYGYEEGADYGDGMLDDDLTQPMISEVPEHQVLGHRSEEEPPTDELHDTSNQISSEPTYQEPAYEQPHYEEADEMSLRSDESIGTSYDKSDMHDNKSETYDKSDMHEQDADPIEIETTSYGYEDDADYGDSPSLDIHDKSEIYDDKPDMHDNKSETYDDTNDANFGSGMTPSDSEAMSEMEPAHHESQESEMNAYGGGADVAPAMGSEGAADSWDSETVELETTYETESSEGHVSEDYASEDYASVSSASVDSSSEAYVEPAEMMEPLTTESDTGMMEPDWIDEPEVAMDDGMDEMMMDG